LHVAEIGRPDVMVTTPQHEVADSLAVLRAEWAALMRIVPDGDCLTVEATVTNQDIGFIEIGQRAAVKVDAFNYMRYGSIEGKIVSLSADAVVPQDANRRGRCRHYGASGGAADALLNGED
jgi:HlyD family secretion protein